MTVDWDRVLTALVVILAGAIILLAIYTSQAHAQTLRQGQPLPSGPPRYYLREGSPQWICAPYGDPKKPSWSCAETADVIRLILKEPPDCGAH